MIVIKISATKLRKIKKKEKDNLIKIFGNFESFIAENPDEVQYEKTDKKLQIIENQVINHNKQTSTNKSKTKRTTNASSTTSKTEPKNDSILIQQKIHQKNQQQKQK